MPNRREFAVTARNYAFSQARLEVSEGDLVKLTLRAEDQVHSFTIDDYRISRRIPVEGSTEIEFQADKPGTFSFYCSLTTDPDCRQVRGQLVVRPR